MLDNVVQLSKVYVATKGSTVSNTAPNSADKALPTFDLIITGEAGDNIVATGQPYVLRYDATDLTDGKKAPPQFSAIVPQNFATANLWKQVPSSEDYTTVQAFPITIPQNPSLSGHVFQYTASLIASKGDVVTFAQSDPFILV